MPTIIDSFLIQFGIDARGVEQGRKKVDDALTRVDRRVEQSGHTADTLADRYLAALKAIRAPGAALERYLDRAAGSAPAAARGLGNVATQAARTGSAVASGILGGGAALRVLSGAALSVGIAVLTIAEAVKKVAEAAGPQWQTALGAATAGLPTQEFNAIQLAAREGGLVPKTETAGTLQSLGQAMAQWRKGTLPDFVTPLARFGITNFGANTSPEEFLRVFAEGASKLSTRDAIAAGSAAHLSPALAKWLHDVGAAGFMKAVGAARPFAETGEQGESAKAFLGALAKLGDHMLYLSNLIATGLEPVLTKMVDALTTVIDSLPLANKHMNPLEPGHDFVGTSGWRSLLRVLGLGGALDSSIPAAGAGTIAEATKYFEDKGLTHAQATGVAARLYAESKLDPNSTNPKSGAYGIAQWLGDRKPAALATGGDLGKQLDLVWKEFQGREAAAFAKIKSATTAPDAARAMESYERAGDPGFTESAANLAARLMLGPATSSPPAAPVTPDQATSFGNLLNSLTGSFRASQNVTNYNQRQDHSGDIHVSVTTSSNDPRRVASAVTDALTRRLAISGNNTGLA